MKKVQQGFTLIELLIVVAIIGILAAIAIPQYQDYVTRSKWQGAVTSVEALKVGLAECAQNNAGNFTPNCVGFNGTEDAATPGLTLTGMPVAPNADFAAGWPAAPVFADVNHVSITIAGDAAVGGCSVVITGDTLPADTNGQSVIWTYQTAAAGGCTKSQTGYDTAA